MGTFSATSMAWAHGARWVEDTPGFQGNQPTDVSARVFRLSPNVIASAAWQSRSPIHRRCPQLTFGRYVPIIERLRVSAQGNPIIGSHLRCGLMASMGKHGWAPFRQAQVERGNRLDSGKILRLQGGSCGTLRDGFVRRTCQTGCVTWRKTAVGRWRCRIPARKLPDPCGQGTPHSRMTSD